MKNIFGRYTITLTLFLTLVIGQIISYFSDPADWQKAVAALGYSVGMIFFRGPIIAIISSVFIWIVLRILGFENLEEVRKESIEDNNPTPAIVFVGTLIASVLFLTLVLKP